MGARLLGPVPSPPPALLVHPTAFPGGLLHTRAHSHGCRFKNTRNRKGTGAGDRVPRGTLILGPECQPGRLRSEGSHSTGLSQFPVTLRLQKGADGPKTEVWVQEDRNHENKSEFPAPEITTGFGGKPPGRSAPRNIWRQEREGRKNWSVPSKPFRKFPSSHKDRHDSPLLPMSTR